MLSASDNRIALYGAYQSEYFFGDTVRSKIGCDNYLIVSHQDDDWKVYNPKIKKSKRVPHHRVHRIFKQMPQACRRELQTGNSYIIVGQDQDNDYSIALAHRIRGGGQFWVDTIYSGTFGVVYGAIAGCAAWTSYKVKENFSSMAQEATNTSTTVTGATLETARQSATTNADTGISELPVHPTTQAYNMLQETGETLSGGDVIETASNIAHETATESMVGAASNAAHSHVASSANTSSTLSSSSGNIISTSLPSAVPNTSNLSYSMTSSVTGGTSEVVQSTLNSAPQETQEALQGAVANSVAENPSFWTTFVTHFNEWKMSVDSCIEPVARTVSQVGWYIPDPF